LHVSAAQIKGAEARDQVPDPLEASEHDESSTITRLGPPVAALMPIETYSPGSPQQPLTPFEGSGRGLWGGDSAPGLRPLRSEWSRTRKLVLAVTSRDTGRR
jgi:antitoxin (DNA-binding transcriptional repressor) of toxin-antitoxin stability system